MTKKIALLLASAVILFGCWRPTDPAANWNATTARNPAGEAEPAHPSGYDEAAQSAGEQAMTMPDGRANQGGTGPAAAEGHLLSGTTGGSIPPAISEPATSATPPHPAPHRTAKR